MILGSMTVFYDFVFELVLVLGLGGVRLRFTGFSGLLTVCYGYFTSVIITTAG